jgi:hypothetical protein
MKRLMMTAAALALLTTAAQADATLYNGKAWNTYYVSDTYDTHTPLCGIMAKLTDAVGGSVMVKYASTNGVTVQAWKQGWSMPAGTTVPFSTELYDKDSDITTPIDATEAKSLTDNGGAFVTMKILSPDVPRFIKAFGDADGMFFKFPYGTEPTWSIRMDDSRAAMKRFTACMQQIGWVGTSATQPVVPSSPRQPVVPSQPAPAQIQPKLTTSELLFVIPPDVSGGHMNVRNGPGANHGLLGAIPAGQTVRASRCVRRDDGIAGADWCLVTWNGLTGWVSQVGLMPVSPQPSQPVARSAASKDDGGV